MRSYIVASWFLVLCLFSNFGNFNSDNSVSSSGVSSSCVNNFNDSLFYNSSS